MSRKDRNAKTVKNRDFEMRGPWLTVKQAAEYLALSEQAVRDLEYRGNLPGHRFGASLRFSRTELDTMLAEGRKATVVELTDGEAHVPPGPLGPLMNREQAVEYLALPSLKALEHRLRRGQIPAYRLGGHWRFRASELDRAITRDGRCLTQDTMECNFDRDARLPRKEVE